MNVLRILYVVPYTPTPVRVRPYNLVRSLVRRGHRVTLATLWQTDDERAALREWRALGVEVIAAPLTRARALSNCVRALPTREPLQAAYCWSPELMRALEARLARREGDQGSPKGVIPFDVIHVEHLRGAPFALRLGAPPATGCPRTPVVWDSVDCITYLFEQTARHSRGLRGLRGRLLARLELGRTRCYEGRLAGRFDRVVVTSEADRDALRQLAAAPSPVEVLPNGVDLDYFAPGGAERRPGAVVFSGKMSYHANAAAAVHLATRVMPLVWARRPDARLVIAGSRPPGAVRRLAAPGRVEVTGHLADLRLPLRQAAVAAAPLLYGAGIQNKVLEAMACATPVVASPLAVAALQVRPGVDCLVAGSPEEQAEAILGLLDDPLRAAQVGAAGRRYVEAHHRWEAVAAQLEALYRDAAVPSPNPNPDPPLTVTPLAALR